MREIRTNNLPPVFLLPTESLLSSLKVLRQDESNPSVIPVHPKLARLPKLFELEVCALGHPACWLCRVPDCVSRGVANEHDDCVVAEPPELVLELLHERSGQKRQRPEWNDERRSAADEGLRLEGTGVASPDAFVHLQISAGLR